MKYIVKLSLQQVTLVKISEELWNQEDVRILIKNYTSSEDYSNLKWQEVEDQVLENVSCLPLHNHLQDHLLCLIRPIGRQIREWCAYHHQEECRVSRMPEQFLWTPRGTIDRKRTAWQLVKDEDLELESRYKLACIYCLEDEIPELWNRFSEGQKEYFCIQKSAIDTKLHKLVEYWSHQLVGRMSELDEKIRGRTGQSNPHVYALHCAVKGANKVATEFFFSKLSDKERATLLVRYAVCAAEITKFAKQRKESYLEVFHFLLSRMTEDQQMETLTTEPYYGLHCFLDWPFQPFFMASAQLIVNPILERYYPKILELITNKIANEWTDFDYRQLFLDFWRLIPLAYKRRFKENVGLFFKLLECGERGILKFMFDDIYAFVKEEEMWVKTGRDLCDILVEEGSWQWLELLIDLRGPSKEVLVRYKEELMEFNVMDCAEYGHNWKTFLSLLDDLIAKKSEERKDDDNIASKNLC